MQSFAALRDEAYGAALLTDCVREYQITGKAIQRLHIRSSAVSGKWGKKTFFTVQDAHLGKIVDTPDAQLQGALSFSFGMHYSKDAVSEGHLAKLAKRYTTPVQCYERADFLNGRLIFLSEMKKKTYNLLIACLTSRQMEPF